MTKKKPPPLDLRAALLPAWRTSNRVTIDVVAHLPPGLCQASIPGAPRRTIRMIAAHLHNSRCSWLDVGHVLTYFVAHEAHHRGQIVMVARQLDQRLPRAVMDGMWWWVPRASKGGRA